MWQHPEPRFMDHGWWWGFWGIVPIVLLAVLVGVVVWAVVRATSRGHAPLPASAPAGPTSRPDGALEEVRLRYARGEMTREEFVQRFRDLGGPDLESGEPAPPETG